MKSDRHKVQDSKRRWPIPLLIGLVLAGLAMQWLANRDEMADFADFPHAYLLEQDAGYDIGKVVISRGPVNPPGSFDTGSGIAWPVYVHPDPTVVPRQNGAPFLIPLLNQGGAPSTPPVPPSGRPLSGEQIRKLVRYQLPEGQAKLDRFAGRSSP